MPGLSPSLRRIHHAQVLHRCAGLLKPFRHAAHVSFQPRLQALKLRPVCIQSDPA